MKAENWIAGMTIMDDFQTGAVLLSKWGGQWKVKTKGGGDVFDDAFADEYHRRPATYADLNREPEVGGLAVALKRADGTFHYIEAGDVLTCYAPGHWKNGGTSWAMPGLDMAPLDAAIYAASQAESGELSGQTMSEPGHTWTPEETDGMKVCCGCGHGDCPGCLARAEIAEAYALHTVWLAVHAPAGDVDRRAAEDHAEAARKRERDAWMRGIR